MALWSTLTGGVVGVGVGEAMGTALEPALEPQRQSAWQVKTPRVFDVDVLADMVAMGLVSQQDAIDEAHRTGYSTDRLNRAIQWRLHSATVEQSLTLWRRSAYDNVADSDLQAKFEHALAKARIESQYWGDLERLKHLPLTAEQTAVAIQRSLIPNEGQLIVDQAAAAQIVGDEWTTMVENQLGVAPTAFLTITPMPQTSLPGYASAEAWGTPSAHLDVLTRIVGLPIAPEQAARLLYRQRIGADDFTRAIAEGNSRIEWAPAFFEAFREILTSNNAAELELRGFIDRNKRLELTLAHGMAEDQSDYLYDVLGRGLAASQVTRGLARGGLYGDAGSAGGPANLPPSPYLEALQRSNIRPEWYDLAFHAYQYQYPSPFFIRTLATAGLLTNAEIEDYGLKQGWPPEWATRIANALAPPNVSAPDPHVNKADTQLWTTAHRTYIAGLSSKADVTPVFTVLGIPDAAQTEVLARWNLEQALRRKELTATQWKKAYTAGATNPTTSQPYTFDEVLAELVGMGYSVDEATVFLEE